MFSSTLPPLAIATKMRDPPSFNTHIRSNRTADGITVQYSHASRYLSYKKALLWRFPSPLAIRTFSFPQAACLA